MSARGRDDPLHSDRTDQCEGWEAREIDFPDDAVAIDAARIVLLATIDFRPPAATPVSSATIGVGRGSFVDLDQVVWLGEWDWAELEADWCWTASPKRSG